MHHRNFKLALLAITLCGGIHACFGQALSFGAFSGTVKDPSGAAIADAKITIQRSDTGVARQTTTDNNGNYRFIDVPVGVYRFEMEHAGFRKATRIKERTTLQFRAEFFTSSIHTQWSAVGGTLGSATLARLQAHATRASRNWVCV
jgi:protocatechuate 3,4-dioxygenase beta subunit